MLTTFEKPTRTDLVLTGQSNDITLLKVNIFSHSKSQYRTLRTTKIQYKYIGYKSNINSPYLPSANPRNPIVVFMMMYVCYRCDTTKPYSTVTPTKWLGIYSPGPFWLKALTLLLMSVTVCWWVQSRDVSGRIQDGRWVNDWLTSCQTEKLRSIWIENRSSRRELGLYGQSQNKEIFPRVYLICFGNALNFLYQLEGVSFSGVNQCSFA